MSGPVGRIQVSNYQIRFRLYPNENWSYSLTLKDIYADRINSTDKAIHIPLPCPGLEFQYQDLSIPTIRRIRNLDAAWTNISHEELLDLKCE